MEGAKNFTFATAAKPPNIGCSPNIISKKRSHANSSILEKKHPKPSFVDTIRNWGPVTPRTTEHISNVHIPVAIEECAFTDKDNGVELVVKDDVFNRLCLP